MSNTQIEPMIAMRGALRLDLPADLIASTEMSDCRNVFFEDGLANNAVSFPVAKDEYFEITASEGTPVIRWKSFGTLSKPVHSG